MVASRHPNCLHGLQCDGSSRQGGSSITLWLDHGSLAASFPSHYLVIGEWETCPVLRGDLKPTSQLEGVLAHIVWRRCWRYHLPQGPSPVSLLDPSWPLWMLWEWSSLNRPFLPGHTSAQWLSLLPFPGQPDWAALKKSKVFCLGNEWPTLAFHSFFIIFTYSLLLEAFQVVGIPQPQMFSSLFWFVGELKGEREKSKNEGKIL